jgi:hypothetical protein
MNEASTYVGVGERMSHRMAPTCNWTDMGTEEHFVQFYESDDFIIEEVAEYMTHGLRSGDTCMIIATHEHLEGIEKSLSAFSRYFDSAVRDGRFIALDAHDTLARILTNGIPDANKFNSLIGGLLSEAADRGSGIRIFGEIVGVLCSNGRYDQAVFVEDLWNELRRSYKFSLFCGYSMHHLNQREATNRMDEICSGHSHVLPTEGYSSITSTNERLRHIALLQQRARQLEAELAELESKIAIRRSAPDIAVLLPLAV